MYQRSVSREAKASLIASSRMHNMKMTLTHAPLGINPDAVNIKDVLIKW
jgi:hypothetical protein